MANLLIIGGTGLISTAIVHRALQQGHRVTVFNRGQRKSRLPDNIETIIGDRKDYDAFEKRFADSRYDVVIDMIAFNRHDTESAIRAFEGRVGHFIHTSTVDVYRRPVSRIPTPEDEPLEGNSDYGRHKVECEEALFAAHRERGFPMTIFRPAQTYGPGGGLVHLWGGNSSFIDRIRKGKPLVVHGDGTSLWSALYIDDAAEGFVGALGREATFGEAYNLTNREVMTWNDYYRRLAGALGKEVRLVPIPSDQLMRIAPKRTGVLSWNWYFHGCYDTRKIARDIPEFDPKVSWEEGARRTVADMEAEGRLQNSDDDDFEDRLIAEWERLGEELGSRLNG